MTPLINLASIKVRLFDNLLGYIANVTRFERKWRLLLRELIANELAENIILILLRSDNSAVFIEF